MGARRVFLMKPCSSTKLPSWAQNSTRAIRLPAKVVRISHNPRRPAIGRQSGIPTGQPNSAERISSPMALRSSATGRAASAGPKPGRSRSRGTGPEISCRHSRPQMYHERFTEVTGDAARCRRRPRQGAIHRARTPHQCPDGPKRCRTKSCSRSRPSPTQITAYAAPVADANSWPWEPPAPMGCRLDERFTEVTGDAARCRRRPRQGAIHRSGTRTPHQCPDGPKRCRTKLVLPLSLAIQAVADADRGNRRTQRDSRLPTPTPGQGNHPHRFNRNLGTPCRKSTAAGHLADTDPVRRGKAGSAVPRRIEKGLHKQRPVTIVLLKVCPQTPQAQTQRLRGQVPAGYRRTDQEPAQSHHPMQLALAQGRVPADPLVPRHQRQCRGRKTQSPQNAVIRDNQIAKLRSCMPRRPAGRSRAISSFQTWRSPSLPTGSSDSPATASTREGTPSGTGTGCPRPRGAQPPPPLRGAGSVIQHRSSSVRSAFTQPAPLRPAKRIVKSKHFAHPTPER